MQIREILDTSRVVMGLTGGSKREVLKQLAAPIADSRGDLAESDLTEALLKREEDSTTAIADGLAMPHGRLPLAGEPDDVLASFGVSSEGVDFESVDGGPTHIFFVLVSPNKHPSLHLRWIAHFALLLKSADLRKALVAAPNADDALAAIEDAEQALSQSP